MGQFYTILWDACGFWSLTNCGCGLQQKKKKPLPWVFLRKMPEKQSILFAWPNGDLAEVSKRGGPPLLRKMLFDLV